MELIDYNKGSVFFILVLNSEIKKGSTKEMNYIDRAVLPIEVDLKVIYNQSPTTAEDVASNAKIEKSDLQYVMNKINSKALPIEVLLKTMFDK